MEVFVVRKIKHVGLILRFALDPVARLTSRAAVATFIAGVLLVAIAVAMVMMMMIPLALTASVVAMHSDSAIGINGAALLAMSDVALSVVSFVAIVVKHAITVLVAADMAGAVMVMVMVTVMVMVFALADLVVVAIGRIVALGSRFDRLRHALANPTANLLANRFIAIHVPRAIGMRSATEHATGNTLALALVAHLTHAAICSFLANGVLGGAETVLIVAAQVLFLLADLVPGRGDTIHGRAEVHHVRCDDTDNELHVR